MPAVFAHDLYGREVYKLLPANVRKVVREEKDCFYLGLQGPDPLFFYHPFSHNLIAEKGHQFHEASALYFFKDGVKKIRRRGNSDRAAAEQAYLLGFCCHFALDSSLHGLISRIDREGIFLHSEIESELDRRLLILEKKNPVRTAVYSHLSSRRRVRKIAAELLGMTDRIMADSIDTMKAAGYLFYCSPEPVKKILSHILMNHNRGFINGMILHKDHIPGCKKEIDELEKRFYRAVPTGAELCTDLFHAIEYDQPLGTRFDRNFE